MEAVDNQKNTILLDVKATTNLKKASRWALVFSIMMCVLSFFAIVVSTVTVSNTLGFGGGLFVASLLMVAFAIVAIILSGKFKRLVTGALEKNDGEALTNAVNKLHRFAVMYLVYMLCNIICLAWFMISLFTVEFYVE